MSTRRISQEEIDKYWTIFSTLSNGGQYLSGAQAAQVLKNSGLSDTQLAAIWDLADVDSDGSLDFEEFCVAMRLIFDLVNGEISAVPKQLPDFLIPESKAHLVAASSALGGGEKFERVADVEEDFQLKDGFDWYMSPSDKNRYEAIYDANADRHGNISIDSLEELYASLDVPDSEVRRAWNLVNPNSHQTINKDAALVFLHILNNRNSGFRIPRTVPASLRSTFERNQIDYNINRSRSPAGGARSLYEEDKPADTYTSKKQAFGDSYLSRMGIGTRNNYVKSGTDFSETTTETKDWEEVRLRRQLADLDEKLQAAERVAREGQRGKSNTAAVRRELEQLLEFKRKELKELDDAERNGLRGGGKGPGQDVQSIRDDLEMLKQQVEGLESHLKTREAVLNDLRDEVEDARRGR